MGLAHWLKSSVYSAKCYLRVFLCFNLDDLGQRETGSVKLRMLQGGCI